MPYRLIIYTTPAEVRATFVPDDTGQIITGVPAVAPDGRAGIGFDIPDNTPDQHGAALEITADGRVPIEQRGILHVRHPLSTYPYGPGQSAAFSVDDFRLQELPEPEPEPIPEPEPEPGADPFSIIKSVYATGKYNLATHTGCGLFTEACADALHADSSATWGHIKKNPGQEQFNGHAIDALMLLRNLSGPDIPTTESGVYDIILNSGVPGAQPAFNRQHGPQPELWYYPAAPILPNTDVTKLYLAEVKVSGSNKTKNKK